MSELKPGASFVHHRSSRTVRVVTTAKDTLTGNPTVVYQDAVEGDSELFSDTQSNFLEVYKRDESADIKVDASFKVRKKANGLFRKPGGGYGTTGKAWTKLGFLKLHLHAAINVSTYYIRNQPGYLDIMKRKIALFVEENEVLEYGPHGVRPVPATEYLPDVHAAILRGETKFN